MAAPKAPIFLKDYNVDGSIFKEDEELKKEETIESHSLFNNNNEFNSEYPKETLDDVVMRINTSDDAKSAGKTRIRKVRFCESEIKGQNFEDFYFHAVFEFHK